MIARFDKVNGDDGLIELKMGMIPRKNILHTSWVCSKELAVEIGFPVIWLQRVLAARLGFEEGPQHEIRSRKFEERHHAKGALARPGGGK